MKRDNTSKWLLPFKRNRRNYEDVGFLPLGLEHDRGFGGDKLYRVVRRTQDGGFVRLLHSASHEQEGPYYRRSDALRALKTHFENGTQGHTLPVVSNDEATCGCGMWHLSVVGSGDNTERMQYNYRLHLQAYFGVKTA